MDKIIQTMKHITLPGTGGLLMPKVGLGTWQAQAEVIEEAVLTALECGYRHFDTAFNYNNEESIGNSLKKWFDSGKGKREDVFITTKLPSFGNRATDVEKFLKLSLQRLQLDYIDLYLIHVPFAFVCDENSFAPVVEEDGSFKLDNNDNIGTWKVMEQQVQKGLVKAIGLSNFNSQQIHTIYYMADIKPSVLQVELHAYIQQKELRSTCKELDIAITAYAPLGSPSAYTHFSNKYNHSLNNFADILGHPIISELANKYSKTSGQILLRHLVQQDIIVIPKSSNEKRIKENINIFDFVLLEEDMEILNSLDRGEQGRIFDFLFYTGVEKHPEYPFRVKS